MKRKTLLFSRPSLLMTMALSCAVTFYSCSESDQFVNNPTDEPTEEDVIENVDPVVPAPPKAETDAPFAECAIPTRSEISVWDGSTKTAPTIADHQARLITINTAEELAWLAGAVIGANGEEPNTFENYTITLNAHIDLGNHEWQPIGSYTKRGSRVTLLPFKGHFNGGKYSISNLKVTGEDYVGLFGYCEGSSCAIINTIVQTGTVTGAKYVGGICGALGEQARIVHTTNGAKVEANTYAGGITGSSIKGLIYNTHNLTDVTATGNYIGGICGRTEGTSIERCTNRGNVIAENSEFVGGLCGEGTRKNGSNSAVQTCSNSGSVKGKKNVGGIYGYMNNNTAVVLSANQGTINGSENTGGIAGYMNKDCGLYYCNNILTGIVTGTKYTGGICGYLRDNVMMTGCHNMAAVNGSEDTGGLAGRQHSFTATRGSANRGKVTGTKNTGGVTGYSYRSTQTASYNVAEITGDRNVGGVTGFLGENSQLYACYSVGNVTGTTRVGGVTGDANSNAKYSGAYWAGVKDGMGVNRKRDVREFGPTSWPSAGKGDGKDVEWGLGEGQESGKYWYSLGSYEEGVYPKLDFENPEATPNI